MENQQEMLSNKKGEVTAGAFVAYVRLAQAYVPWQRYGVTFNPREALEKGTLFPELYRPYPN